LSRLLRIALILMCCAAVLAWPLATASQGQSPVATPALAISPLPTPTATAAPEAGGAVPLLLVGFVVGLALGVALVLIARRASPNER